MSLRKQRVFSLPNSCYEIGESKFVYHSLSHCRFKYKRKRDCQTRGLNLDVVSISLWLCVCVRMCLFLSYLLQIWDFWERKKIHIYSRHKTGWWGHCGREEDAGSAYCSINKILSQLHIVCVYCFAFEYIFLFRNVIKIFCIIWGYWNISLRLPAFSRLSFVIPYLLLVHNILKHGYNMFLVDHVWLDSGLCLSKWICVN